jgi:antitoxin component YwqK of YwqJK toxin-antitoxin module
MNFRIITLLFFFFISSLSLNAQTFELGANGDTINVTDASGQRQGYWRIKNAEKNLPGYEPEQVVEEGKYINGKKEGVWKQYFPNDKLKSEITYVNNIPNGYSKFYYKNGNISEEGIWKINKWDGSYKYYYENGQIAYDWNFLNGKREGKQKYYYENGQVHYDGEWSGGQENGVLKEYSEDGQLMAEKVYNKGRIDTLSSKYYEVATVKKKEEPAQQEEPVVEQQPKEAQFGGVFGGTGDHVLYTVINGQKKVSREGYFKDGYLINGKEYKYDEGSGKLMKTLIYSNGKITSVIE